MEKHSLQVTKDTPITQEIPRVVGVLCHFLGGEGFVKDRIYFCYTTGVYQDDSGYVNMIYFLIKIQFSWRALVVSQ